IPAGILTFLALGSALWAIGRVFLTDHKLRTFRAAYMFTIAGFFMTGWAVYFWESTYVLFTFLLGSGFWLLDREEVPVRNASRRDQIKPIGSGRDGAQEHRAHRGSGPPSSRPPPPLEAHRRNCWIAAPR